jgi:hypothetical protein
MPISSVVGAKSRLPSDVMHIARLAAFALMLFGVAGCASHADHTKEARSALDVGNSARALEL